MKFPVLIQMLALQHIIFLATISLITTFVEAQSENNKPISCDDDDLNHSILVECNKSQCDRYQVVHQTEIWPSSATFITHISTTRSGQRFKSDLIPKLNDIESDFETAMNINVTLDVKTDSYSNVAKSEVLGDDILGFGATLDIDKLFDSIDQESSGAFGDQNGLIFGDLFGNFRSSLRLNILRLVVEPRHIPVAGKFPDLMTGLNKQVLEIRQSELEISPETEWLPIKLVLDFRHFDEGQMDGFYKLIQSLPSKRMEYLDIWAIAIDDSAKLNEVRAYIQNHIDHCHVFLSTSLSQALRVLVPRKHPLLEGILLKSEPSMPYNILEQLKLNYKNLTIVTIGGDRPRSRDYGDWQNAQTTAVEILNHLKYGSSGYIEEKSVTDTMAENSWPYDSSIYSLHDSHMIHFRGPLYYALGHFSRHLPPGSKTVRTTLSTQPCMFNAHYLALETPGDLRYIVALILNNNEHLLPFRMVTGSQVLAHEEFNLKSFNTLILR